MRLTATFLAVITWLPALVHALTLQERQLNRPGRYIVTLKDGASGSRISSSLSSVRKSGVVEVWDNVFNGFAADLSESDLKALKDSPDVLDIEEDGVVHAFSPVTQTNAPWGLARISSNTPLTGNPATSTFRFTYDSTAGAGVDIYIFGTGVRTTHVEFGGRARFGAVFSGTVAADGHGHGTHCAGIAAGTNVGVAKRANVVAVKVLSDSGSSSVSTLISGINWIAGTVAASGRPSVVLMALGGGASTALDSAVVSLTNAGIHVVVAAGGSNQGVENTSPARVPSVITVGAITFTDSRTSFSNYGAGIDVYAPGQNINSSWATSDTAYNTLSGTSMAAAYVTGVVAYLLGLLGNLSPAAMEAKVKELALKGILTGIPSGTNALIHIA
ncbi:subtilisin-like protein [Coprinopsis marcescibilis]|uniref:Subtilisin-like protein n=1 Tax=Coprinopsis marcescibilis TaxID=230819 RepID=A0A5C3KMP3_COPMA|nr:subtilisin-like protein [Coprinopsis marcescibilis]